MIRRIKHRIKELLGRKSLILMYHQVCHRKSDPWELSVSPENFGEQMTFLKKNFDVVPLEEISNAVRNKNTKHRKIAITFDDGFKDNYINACPVLNREKLPATFYMATHPVTSGEMYWWEELENAILHTDELPEEITLTIGGVPFHFRFYSDRQLSKKTIDEIRVWSAGKPITNKRTSLYFELWSRIQPLSFTDQRRIMNEIKRWAGLDPDGYSGASIMSTSDVKAISTNPLFSIGAHTVHHPMLATQDEATQVFEVQQSRKTIEQWVAKPVNGFAYPYGNYNTLTKKILEQYNFEYGVSTESRSVTNRDDIFALPRMQVKNWNEKEFSHNIRQILSA